MTHDKEKALRHHARGVAQALVLEGEVKAEELLNVATMVAKQLERHREDVVKTIGVTVNGKIDKANAEMGKIHEILMRQNEKIDEHHTEHVNTLMEHNRRHEADMKVVKAHMDADEVFKKELKPFLEAKAGFKVFRSFLIWVAGFIIAWNTVKNGIKLW